MAVAVSPIAPPPPVTPPPPERVRSTIRTVRAFRATPFTYATLIVVSAILSVPLVFVVSIALASDQSVTANAFTIIPREFHWENFTRVFGTDLPCIGSC